jgi:hypothetical protein
VRINDLEREITVLVRTLAPTLLTRPGIGVLTTAKLLGETADITRFRNKDAYARHTGTAPLPAWSGNRTRHRLARTGNRQLNCAIHRIAVTQGRCHPEARAFLQRRIARGNTPTEARRALKRRLSDLVYRDRLDIGARDNAELARPVTPMRSKVRHRRAQRTNACYREHGEAAFGTRHGDEVNVRRARSRRRSFGVRSGRGAVSRAAPRRHPHGNDGHRIHRGGHELVTVQAHSLRT